MNVWHNIPASLKFNQPVISNIVPDHIPDPVFFNQITVSDKLCPFYLYFYSSVQLQELRANQYCTDLTSMSLKLFWYVFSL